jgi:hypothetical protein
VIHSCDSLRYTYGGRSISPNHVTVSSETQMGLNILLTRSCQVCRNHRSILLFIILWPQLASGIAKRNLFLRHDNSSCSGSVRTSELDHQQRRLSLSVRRTMRGTGRWWTVIRAARGLRRRADVQHQSLIYYEVK